MTNPPFNNRAAKPDAGRPSTKISDLKPGRNLFYYLCDVCICWPDQSYEIEWLARTSGNNPGSRLVLLQTPFSVGDRELSKKKINFFFLNQRLLSFYFFFPSNKNKNVHGKLIVKLECLILIYNVNTFREEKRFIPKLRYDHGI